MTRRVRKQTVRVRPWLPLAVLLAAAAVAGAIELARLHRRRAVEAEVARHLPLIAKHARRNSVPAALVCAIVRAESGGDPSAVSSKGARGLMQIMPVAEREVVGQAGGDLFDPDYNISVGTRYLRMLLDQFEGNQTLAVAAYHMGPTRTAQLRRAHPMLPAGELIDTYAPRSTQKYVRTVLGH